MNNELIKTGILGMGSSFPEKVLTNFDLEKMVDTSDEWISKRTGISERRILEEKEQIFELGIKAAKRAIDDACIKPEEIDMIIASTSTPDYLSPSTSCLIQKGVGATNACAFDVNAACTGFIYALSTASQFIATGFCKYVLVVGCEGLSKVIDWEDRNTCVLFGDGSGAAVVGPVEEDYGILSACLGSDGGLSHLITIPCCSLNDDDIKKRPREIKRSVWLDGSEVFKFAVRIMVEATENVIRKAGLTLDQIKLVIPHQANIRIIDGASKRLGLSAERVFTNLHKYGNISSASIPVALEEAFKDGLIKKGDYIVLVGFGGGLTWGSILIKWNK